MLNNGKIVTLTGAKSKSLKTPSGKVLAKVSKVTYEVIIVLIFIIDPLLFVI
jgi:hypothetical protein